MASDTKVPPHPSGPPTSQPPRKPDDEDDDNRTYRGVAFASDAYVPWAVGSLRLRNADLSRMESSGVPVLRSHEPDNLVGAVTRVEKAEGVWRSNWRLPKKPWNADTFDQLDSGVLAGISVGGNIVWNTLTIDNEGEADWGDPDSLRFSADWQLVEQSLTAIPADFRAGIDRTAKAVLERSGALFDSLISTAGITTLETPSILQRLQSLVSSHNESVTLRREQAMTMKPLEQTVSRESIERAIAAQLERNESLKALTEVPAKLDKIAADAEAEAARNMEYRAKLDQLQFQPNGQVLQMSNWKPGDDLIDLGKILRLTAADDLGFPPLDRSGSSLEESLLEQLELEPAGRSTVARLPFAVIENRQRQLMLQRNTLAGGGGARPVEVNISGDGGLLLSAFSPVLASMDVRSGLSGGQKLPYWTAQGSAAGGAESSDIPISTWTLADAELLPISIATAFEISSSLRGRRRYEL